MINQETKDIDNISIIFDDLNEWDKQYMITIKMNLKNKVYPNSKR